MGVNPTGLASRLNINDEKAIDCSDAIDDLHESLAELYQNSFDAIQEDYSNQLELIEKQSDALDKKISVLETEGYMKNANYYVQLQEIEKQNIAMLNNEVRDLTEAFENAMSSGEIDEGSEAWYEMKINIEDTKAAIDDANQAIAEYASTIRSIEWEYFDYAQERISNIATEAAFLLNLIEEDDMMGEDGNPTDSGMSTLGLNAEKYDLYMMQADKYAGELKKINKELASDPNNKELLDRREELLEAQQDSILAAKDEKDAMIDLAKEGIQTELDAVQELIDAYTESLDTAKDLYDYQKNIAEKTSDIASLEKQLAAYQNDMSEETRSKIQKIEVDLKEAREDLQDTEYDQFISDAKTALDSMYSEYEEILNARFDDVDALFEKLIEYVNTNHAEISEYLSKETEAVGYTITDATSSIWSNGGAANSVVAAYSTDISLKLTSVGQAVQNILAVLEGIASANGVSFGAKSYASGGLIDYTGVANVHGSSGNPELVLNAADTENFIALRDTLRSMSIDSADLGSVGSINSLNGSNGGYSVGAINVSIPIAHVSDYNDFVTQLKKDKQFEQMVQDVTIGRIAGKNSLSKNKYSWS